MMEPAVQFRQRLQAEAETLGFSLFGVTRPVQPPHYATYQDWINNKRHAAMEYLARPDSEQKRSDPAALLAGCRSIICVGIRYPRPIDITEPPADPSGRVAAYAWGADYHEVIIPRLRSLADWIAQETSRPVLARPYTDTGPLLERDLAQQAGLGWIGKNTCLINPRQGSYFLLAELLLDIDLEPDSPFLTDQCGSCTRCIDSCPTNAIRLDRTLEAELCISYQTIENKGSIPVHLRRQIGDWVFGCDICQQVCPWNIRFAAPQSDPAFHPQPGTPRLDLREALQITPEQFNRRFKNSPLRRAKRRGLLRNAAVALGNTKDPSVVPALQAALVDELEPLVRAHAAWALGQIGSAAALLALAAARATEMDASVQAEIELALSHSGEQ